MAWSLRGFPSGNFIERRLYLSFFWKKKGDCMRIGRIQNDKLKMRNPPKLEKHKLYKVLEKGCPHFESEYAIPPKAPITKDHKKATTRP